MKNVLGKKWHVLFILVLLAGACKKDFLNVPDNSYPLRQSYVTDLKTTEDYLNGIYLELASYFYHGYAIIYPDLIADNVKPVTGSNALMPHYSWAQQSDEEVSNIISPEGLNMNPSWFAGYRIAGDCSFVIESADRYRAENEEKADNLKGQASALRALVHAALVNVFSQPYNFTADASHPGIPYITSSDWTKVFSRATVAAVYDHMIADLGDAIRLLPTGSDNVLMMTGNAAKALLARIYLYKGDFQAAKDLATAVAAITPLMKMPDYPAKLFTAEETEALFQLPPAWGGAGSGNYYTYFAGLYFDPSFQQFVATGDIASVLKESPADARNVWVAQDGENWNVTKYPGGAIDGFPLPSLSYYHTILRSSEMFLVAAESYAKLSQEDSARVFLDMVRKRADPGAPATIGTGQALLDAIHKEWRKEFAFEGHRMFDLLRWNKNVYREDASIPVAKELIYPSNKAIAPIPATDVNLSGLPQNSGY
ncbi:RagB/SusD family nutrient uptake outer membrane protein [Chitinophaga japonensis]|uniref:SusD-like starch-binding protein associating with outer membrane n=1 Tax=Chitinophaga japonensis TaxID=104662 RepID=A0A562SSY3_CHIJA|nr:RagB/SusD family nutrient uptake outer membrane protein [Chitinophaga japonensis]TWI84361.1 SusD-like starch-binding protein associating with outer membrane [Chitinophaga japonensis]